MRKATIGLGIGLTVLALGAALAIGIGVVGAKGGDSGFFAALNGDNEIPDADPDGRGTSSFVIDNGQVCFGISVANIANPIAAHIHEGKKNVNGPVVVPLIPHPTTGDPGASSGCVLINSDLEAAIAKHPNHYYVNVHTGDFPGGAVRGQIFSK